MNTDAASTRSAALIGLEIGQAVLFGVLVLVTGTRALLDAVPPGTVGGPAPHVIALVAGVVGLAALFVVGLATHRRLGRRGRAGWAVAVLVAIHLLMALNPAFAFLAFPGWLLIGQLLPLGIAVAVAGISVTLTIQALGAATSAAVLGPLIGAGVALGIARGVLRLEAEAHRTRRLLAEVVAAHAEAERLADEVASAQHEAGVQAERARLASDIHDTLAQGFSSIVLLARAGLRDNDPGRRGVLLTQIEATASDNLAEARRVVHALAPAPLATSGLAGGLGRLADDLSRQTGLQVETHVDPDLPRLPVAVEVALLRGAQGVLGNVRSHAGASRVGITLDAAGGELRLDIVDDGQGFDPGILDAAPTTAGGYGLRSLRERLVALGGGLDVESEPGGGTAVALHVPWTGRSASDRWEEGA